MASFTGTKIKDTYPSILKVFDNGALDGTVQVITDGLGNSSALWLGTGAATITGDMSVWENFNVDTDTLVVDSIQDRVGINIGLPTEALDVVGNVKASGTLRVEGNATFDTNISVGGIIRNVNDLDTSISFGTNQISLITGGLTRLSASDASVQVTNALVASSTLSVTGNYNSTSGDISLANGKIVVGGSVSIANSVGAASFSPNANLLVIGDTGAAANQGMTIVSPTGATGNIYFADGTTGTERYRGSVTYNHNEEKMFLGVNATNIVSIDSISANVTGNFNATGSITGGNINASSLAVSGNLTVDTNTLFVDAANNRVGVGTTVPSKLVEIVHQTPNSTTANSIIAVSSGTTYGSTANPKNLDYSFLGDNQKEIARIRSVDEIGSIDGGYLSFFTSSAAGTVNERMRILRGGDISFRDSSANEAFYWDASDARLGIGTSSFNVFDIVNISGTDSVANDLTLTGPNTSQVRINFADPEGQSGEVGYNHAIDAMRFVTSGAERMRIDSSGNVGIGASPTAKLDVNSGATNQAAAFRSTDSGAFIGFADPSTTLDAGYPTVSVGAVANDMTFATNNIERMRIDSSGNVALTGNEQELLFHSNYSVGNTDRAKIKVIGAGGGSGYGGDLTFYTKSPSNAYSERMRIDSSGNVGVGTQSPELPLDVRGVIQSKGADSLIRIGQLSATATYIQSISADTTTSRDLIFYGTSETMRIDSSGNVGVGTQSPASYISRFIEVSNATSAGIKLTSTSGLNSGLSMGYIASDKSFRITNYESTGIIRLDTQDTERMRINSGGDVLVGASSVNGAGGITLRSNASGGSNGSGRILFNRADTAATSNVIEFNNNSSPVGSITHTNTATAYNTSSDYRLKEGWVSMEGALDRVDALKPVNFAWKADGKRVDGFLAHELAEVVPEAVTGEKDATEIRSVEVSPAVYEDVIHPAEEAILDEEGNVIQEAKEEWVEKVLVSEAVFEDQEFPVYQGIDQSKIVPLLAAGLQEAHALIKELRAELNALKQA